MVQTVSAEAGSQTVTPDGTVFAQVSKSDGLAHAAHADDVSNASTTYYHTGVNVAGASVEEQLVQRSVNGTIGTSSEIALESSGSNVDISNESNTESVAELERSNATVNITTEDGGTSSISLSETGDGVNLSDYADATIKTEDEALPDSSTGIGFGSGSTSGVSGNGSARSSFSSSKMNRSSDDGSTMSSSSNISIRVQEESEEELEEELKEELKKKGMAKKNSSLIGLETMKDAVNLGAPMKTAV